MGAVPTLLHISLRILYPLKNAPIILLSQFLISFISLFLPGESEKS